MSEPISNEEEVRRNNRAERLREMKRKKMRQAQIRRNLRIFGIPAVCLVVIIGICIGMNRSSSLQKDNQATENKEGSTIETDKVASEIQTTSAQAEAGEQSIVPSGNNENGRNAVSQPTDAMQTEAKDENTKAVFTPAVTASTVSLGEMTSEGETMASAHAILVDADTGDILAQKDAQSRINPASMTKVLTILVAAEHVTNVEDTFTMPIEITDFCYSNDCSNAGFEVDEVLTIKDLFYGTILPSGGEAALGLAYYVAGSQEAFVELMNEKLQELGLSDTAHFTNCMGIYGEDHYCSTEDVAVIMKAAMDNEFCREVLSAHTYTTSITEQHPEGMILSNWFLRRIEDKDSGGIVVGAKTGYVVQSGNCAVSYSENEQGKGYICVTGDAYSGWRCIYDHVAIYHQFL